MKLLTLSIRNYRTLESTDIKFPTSYTAICGANDSGKTNVIRAIQALVRDDRYAPFMFSDDDQFSIKENFPKWKDTNVSKREISFAATFELERERDTAFYEFVTTQLSIEDADDTLRFSLSVIHRANRPEPIVTVNAMGKEYTDLKAQEVLKRLRSSGSVRFHNSTEMGASLIYHGPRVAAGYIREIAAQHASVVDDMKKAVNRGFAKISKSQQAQLETLLGRLQTKYKVGLSMPAFNFDYIPFSITLGETKFEVPLEDWGSGTINRTLVLLTLFQARQIGEAEPSASKVTPIIVVEEPESFLHPSAQAEFGRILRDLSEEFRVQVIVTTHSPYLLNLEHPTSNILLRRRVSRRKLRESEVVDTSGDSWMEPFGQALGLDSDEFKPWKSMLLSPSDCVLLVEGDTDREYFRMLQCEDHGESRLSPKWDIMPYDGTGSLSNTVLLRFVRHRYRRFFVTFDLDSAERVEKTLKGLQLARNKYYLPIGCNEPGKRCIEGLLPDCVTQAVHASNTALLQAVTNGTANERKQAKRELKRLLLEEFKKQSVPGEKYFGGFYALTKVINKALA